MSAARSSAKPKTAKPKTTAPVQLKKRPKEAAREPLFSVDGVDYTMPVTVELGTSIALAALLRIEPDEDAKRIMLVRELCGPPALAALLGDSTMTRAEWDTIGRILTERAFGAAEREEDEEGN